MHVKSDNWNAGASYTKFRNRVMNKAEIEARKLQDEAVMRLCSALGLPANTVSGEVERAVECIVLAATLTTMAWMKQAQEQE